MEQITLISDAEWSNMWRELTKEELIKASVPNIFINQEAFGAFNAATQKPDQVLVLDSTDQIYLVEEVVHPLKRVEHQPLYCNNSSIREDPLEHRTSSSLA